MSTEHTSEGSLPGNGNGDSNPQRSTRNIRWRKFIDPRRDPEKDAGSSDGSLKEKGRWNMGMLRDRETDEVPGTVLLMPAYKNKPLGQPPERHTASTFPSQSRPRSEGRSLSGPIPIEKKHTADGRIVLDPQPDDSLNDPLNWPMWRRDCSLLSVGFYSMLGGGMTPLLAAGFDDVSKTYEVTTQEVAHTTGLYMLGLGIGSVIMSPTAILYGKRPVYLMGTCLFVLTSIWCALSPTFNSLLVARICMGIAVSPVECLPSATIAEIYFLHERAYRVGIYTLLLLGGKNLVPLAAAAIISTIGWRWVFWVVSIIAGFCFILLFLFVPETFWDRTPTPKSKRPGLHRSVSDLIHRGRRGKSRSRETQVDDHSQLPNTPRQPIDVRVDLADEEIEKKDMAHPDPNHGEADHRFNEKREEDEQMGSGQLTVPTTPTTPKMRRDSDGHLTFPSPPGQSQSYFSPPPPQKETPDLEAARVPARSTRGDSISPAPVLPQHVYTHGLRKRPQVPYTKTLKIWTGRLAPDKWWRVAVRPFILFCYPAALWSAMVYAFSVGWLIALSETIATIFHNRATYNFGSMQMGLVYVSPFVGGILGSAVAGKLSDIIVRWITRRNGGVYEPEFRLVMALPIAVATATGLMGFGWSAQERDLWIVPVIFFGIVSFGCCLGSTTAITFVVDSYRQYAGEALVTLNFSKNIFHGLVFSFFFVKWVEGSGSKDVFVIIGCLQLGCMLSTIPMYIYGKRARMWTMRKNLMEKF